MAHSQHNRSEESRRRPQFWSHPAQYHRHPEDEYREEQLLATHSFPASPSSSRNNRVTRSLIPFSPGQTLGSDSQLNSPSPTMEYSYRQVNSPIDAEEYRYEQERSSNCCSSWLLCCCLPSGRSGNPTEQFHSRHPRRNRSGGHCLKILYALLSLATVGGLIYYTKTNDQSWTMIPGESRHVATAGFLTDSVQVVSRTPSTHHHYDSNETISRGMAVYAVGHPSCPPLTGPPVTLDAPPQELVLLRNAFEYQYYYLNKGSTMEVTVHQTKGATNILVLKGNKVLARIQDKKKKNIRDIISDLELAFSMEEIIVESFSFMNERAPIQFSFTSPGSDLYVILYDNAASNEPAAFNVSYHMVLTTYDLEELVPWCSHSAPAVPYSPSVSEETSFTCPPVQVAEAGCVIVQATEGHGGSHNTTTDTVYLVGDGGVEVTLYTTRRWLYIGGLSVVPSALLALFCWYRRWKRRHRLRHREHPYHHQSRQQQESREVPNYHYLPPQHQEYSDREEVDHDGVGDGGPEEARISRHRRDGSATFRPTGQTSNRFPCAAEAENEVDASSGTTIMIPSSNVIVKPEEE